MKGLPANRIRLRVYGALIDVERVHGEWRAYHAGTEGKRRDARDIVIPPEINRDQVATYIADLLHERATERYPDVEELR